MSKKGRERALQERLAFVRQWAAYVRSHPNSRWSSQQKDIIDSQLENSRQFQDAHMRRLQGGAKRKR